MQKKQAKPLSSGAIPANFADSVDPNFIDSLWLSATNDGQAYRFSDPTMAVDRAFAEYQASQRESEQEDFQLIRQKLIHDLAIRWRKGDR